MAINKRNHSKKEKQVWFLPKVIETKPVVSKKDRKIAKRVDNHFVSGGT